MVTSSDSIASSCSDSVLWDNRRLLATCSAVIIYSSPCPLLRQNNSSMSPCWDQEAVTTVLCEQVDLEETSPGSY